MVESVEYVGKRRENWKDDCVFRKDSCGHCYWKDRWPERPACHKMDLPGGGMEEDLQRSGAAAIVLRGLLLGQVDEAEIETGLELIVSVGALALKKLTKLRELRKGVKDGTGSKGDNGSGKTP